VRRGFEVDEEGFFRAMELQKERSRASWKGGAGGGAALDSLVKEAKGELPRTTFTGYEACEGESRVCLLALVGEGGLSGTTRAGEGSLVALAMSSTPFYGESGGQVGDAGVIESAGARVRVEDTQRARGGEVLVHFGTVEEGELAQGDAVRQRVDAERRSRIMSHHSGTHLVHHALREILGVHVQQKGSFVGPDHLRFDFSHPRSVGRDELTAIEARVNELVRANHEVVTEVLPYKTAIERGALAFFGDKYGDEVRMVTMGPSKELCGGTHVVRTGNLGFFTFSHEGSVASGVRRIEALAGIPAESKLRDLRERLESVASVLRSGPDDVAEKLLDLTEEVKRLKRKIAELERESASAARASLASSAKNVAGHRVIVGAPNVDTREALRELGDLLRASGKATVVVLGAEMEGKVALVAAVSDDVVKKGILRAGDLVGRVAKVAGGGGGGSPHLATAGAKDPSKLSEALEAVPSIVGEILS
jgi:alanyl-tRNA synthetase